MPHFPNRPSVRLYLNDTLMKLLQDKAESFGLRVSQYVRFIVVSSLNPENTEKEADEVLKKKYPE